MLNLESFALLAIYSLGLRWLLFKYVKLRGVRSWLTSLDFPLIGELMRCPYCQTIEASLVVYLGLWHWHHAPIAQTLLGATANGWLCILIEAWAESAIAEMESADSPDHSRASTWGFFSTEVGNEKSDNSDDAEHVNDGDRGPV